MAAANFEPALSFTLKEEGGYVNNPRDPGGPTNMGITQATLSHELGRHASVADVKAITRATAASIYRKKFWSTIDGDKLEPGVDLMLFDICVNSGPGRSKEFYDKTAALKGVARIRAIDKLRVGFWRHLRTFSVFGRGWLRRENECLAAALRMAKSS